MGLVDSRSRQTKFVVSLRCATFHHPTVVFALRRSSLGAAPTLQGVHDLPLGISEPSSRTPSTADLNVSPRSRSISKARSAKHTAVSISR